MLDLAGRRITHLHGGIRKIAGAEEENFDFTALSSIDRHILTSKCGCSWVPHEAAFCIPVPHEEAVLLLDFRHCAPLPDEWLGAWILVSG